MHQIQPNGNIRDYLRHSDVNKECKMEDKKSRASRRMKQEETQKWRKLFYNKCITLYFALTNIVLEIYKQITALPNSKLRMHLKQELVLT